MEENGLTNWKDYFQPWPPDPATKPEDKYWEVGRQHTWDLPQEFHYTTWTAQCTIDNIEQSVRSDKPFFTWASFHDPHPPYLVPEPWASMYSPDEIDLPRMQPGELDRMPPHYALTQHEKPDYSPWKETKFANHGFHTHRVDEQTMRRNIAVYYGMVSFMDQQIGRILDRLDQLRIAENTLIVFTTDHGHFFGQHGLVAKGAFHYEDLLRLPFIVRYPGQTRTGKSSASLQALVDLAPSFLSAAGISVPGMMQGLDQSPVWRGEAEAVRNEVVVENRHQPTAVHLRTYIDQRYKITVYRDQPYGELFDLQADPGEVNNRWDEPAYQEVKLRLMHKFINAELRREPMRYPRIAGA